MARGSLEQPVGYRLRSRARYPNHYRYGELTRSACPFLGRQFCHQGGSVTVICINYREGLPAKGSPSLFYRLQIGKADRQVLPSQTFPSHSTIAFHSFSHQRSCRFMLFRPSHTSCTRAEEGPVRAKACPYRILRLNARYLEPKETDLQMDSVPASTGNTKRGDLTPLKKRGRRITRRPHSPKSRRIRYSIVPISVWTKLGFLFIEVLLIGHKRMFFSTSRPTRLGTTSKTTPSRIKSHQSFPSAQNSF